MRRLACPAALLLALPFLAGRLGAQAGTPCDTKASPTALFSADCPSLSCTFALQTSPPPAGSTLEWDFGDGSYQLGAAQTAAHTYAAGGFYLVTLIVTEPNGQAARATSGISLGGTVPLAADDAYSTQSDTPLGLSLAELLSNDAPGVTFVSISPPSKCPLSADGRSCTYSPPYQPAPGTEGTDSFTYTVRDGAGHTGSATVTVTFNLPLVANPDYFTFLRADTDSVLTLQGSSLLANDSLGAMIVRAENPTKGTLEPQTDPAVFQFKPSEYGLGGFDYLISWDGISEPYETGHVYIDIKPSPPQAIFTVTCVQRTCTVNTSSRPAVGLTIQKYYWDWGDGSPVLDATLPFPWADQTHVYARSGRFTITHTVVDSYGLSGSLTREAVPNSTPVAVNDTAATERDVPLTIPVLANDSDADGDALSIYNVDVRTAYPGADYQLVQSGGRWAILLTPPDTFVGTMTFHYTASDPLGAASIATVTLTVNQWSVILDAVGEQFYTGMGHPIRIAKGTLLSNDYHSQGAALSIVSVDTSILMGSLDCTTDPTACTYTPPGGGTGYSLFRYTLQDPAGRRDTASVRIYVSSVGHEPSPADDLFTTSRNTAKSFTLQDIVQNDLDPDGDALAVALPSGPRTYGSLSCSSPFYLCSYTPNAGFVGLDRFNYTASDSLNPSKTATIGVLTLPPATPTFDAREDVVVTGVNQPAFINKASLASNDYAPSGGPVTVTSVDSTGTLGSLACDATSCTYSPSFGYSGSTTFRYTANDGHGATDTAIVKIRVGGSNLPPIPEDDTLTATRNTPLTFSVFQLLKNDSDPEMDPLTVTVSPYGAHRGVLSCSNPSYWCTYTPTTNLTGPDPFTYTLSDGQSSVTKTLTIQVNP